MRRTSRGLASLASLAAMVATGACHRGDQSQDGAAVTLGSTSSAASGVTPRDHLAPGELLEGNLEVFGLKLPRGSKVVSQYPQQLVAACDSKATEVANYVRPRVSMGTVSVGAASTIFERVQVAENPGRELVIKVEEAPIGSGSLITVRDVTAPFVDPSLTDEQRWRQVGMTPGGGKIADPTHLH